MTIHNRLYNLNIDTTLIGIEKSDEENWYFCTPKSAKVVGWAGVDGIHFCFVRGFGEMVFAVNPANTLGDYVHPLAKSFADFLRLILACGHTAAIEQAHNWNQVQFETFLSKNPITEKQLSVINIIAKKLRLKPMVEPFIYIKQLQAEFDYSKIKFTQEYNDLLIFKETLPPWKVYFDGGFWSSSGKQRAGEEIPTNVKFVLNNKSWHIPAIYSCSKGLIVDCCVQIPKDEIIAFMKKWNLSAENDGDNYTRKQQFQISAENPLLVNINSEIIYGGKKIPSSHGCALSWNPCLEEHNSRDSEGVINHYKLSKECGWVVLRLAFPWLTKRKPRKSTIDVTIRHDPITVLGSQFSVSGKGESVDFIHPITNLNHTLTVHQYQQQQLSSHHFTDKDYEYPTNYTVMTYTIDPAPIDDSFSMSDCDDGDRPRKKYISPLEPEATADCMISLGIIGGADNVTIISSRGNTGDKQHYACSSLRFGAVDSIQWQIVCHKKCCTDMIVKII